MDRRWLISSSVIEIMTSSASPRRRPWAQRRPDYVLGDGRDLTVQLTWWW
jgi:hypothetical protein